MNGQPPVSPTANRLPFSGASQSPPLDPALEVALDALKTGDFRLRWEAAKTLSKAGGEAIAPLLTILEEEEADWELLWFVARVLGDLPDPTAIAALVHLLQTTDNPEVAGMTATALANQGEAAIPALTHLLTQTATRILAVQALAQIRHPSVIAPLLDSATDTDPIVRATGLEALSHFYTPAISDILFCALGDPIAQVRKAAVIGLGLQADRQDKPRLVQRLQPLLWDLNLEVCRQAIIALGRVGTSDAVAVLANILQSPHTPTLLQVELVRVLAWIGSIQAIEGLRCFFDRRLDLGHDNDEESLLVYEEAVTALGRVEPPEAKLQATEMLLNLLTSHHPAVRTTRGKQLLILSLGQLGQIVAMDSLIQLLSDADGGVKFHAIAALKQLDARLAYERLVELSRDSAVNPALKAGVILALQEWHGAFD